MKKFMVDLVRCYIPPRLFLFMEGCALFGVLLLTLPPIAAPVGGIPRTIKDSSAKTTSRCAATSTLSNWKPSNVRSASITLMNSVCPDR